MKKYLLALLLLCPLQAYAQSSMLICTEMWCNEGLVVDLQANAWPAGEYTFKVQSDDAVAVTCKAALPLNPCEEQSVTCDGEGVLIGQSGCALSADQHYFNEVRIVPPPKFYSLDITAPNGKTFHTDGAVEAECSYPNGEQCDIRQCCAAQTNAVINW